MCVEVELFSLSDNVASMMNIEIGLHFICLNHIILISDATWFKKLYKVRPKHVSRMAMGVYLCEWLVNISSNDSECT